MRVAFGWFLHEWEVVINGDINWELRMHKDVNMISSSLCFFFFLPFESFDDSVRYGAPYSLEQVHVIGYITALITSVEVHDRDRTDHRSR